MKSGAWQACGRGVYVGHNGPVTIEQRRWAALLACGPDAALAGRTVLQLHGLSGWERDSIDIAVPQARHGAKASGALVIRMRQLDDFFIRRGGRVSCACR